MSEFRTRAAQSCRFDLVSLGEVMLRLDPGELRVHTARTFQAWEGGGEYNVARGLRRCFGLRAAVVTALADNPIGRLVEDLMLQGGVDLSYLQWRAYDGVGRNLRNGLNFVERGFGPRAALSCSDRGHTAISQLKPTDVDFQKLFSTDGARWLHTGGIFCALGPETPAVAQAAMEAAMNNDVRVSYDLNYRDSLWRSFGGPARAQAVNRSLMPLVDVLFGNEEDFTAALGFELKGVDRSYAQLPLDSFRTMIEEVIATFPNIRTVATTLRVARSASVNGWGALCYHEGEFFEVPPQDLQIFDRVGGGDSFASGFIYGLLSGKSAEWALGCGVAHGALAMSTPGDTTMVTLPEVLRAMQGASARIER
ncbi:MAG TPA: sugar kinase [Polyangiaceae bacterium]|nr:sugar kinase [Polyangiaceae bacterium]